LQGCSNGKFLALRNLYPYFWKGIHSNDWNQDHCILFKLTFLLQAFTIDRSSAIKVKGLTIKNSQQMHFVISQSDSVRVYAVQVSAPGDSPNTDGIHITASTNVVLQDCKIGTG
jgi:hypothetical protein